MQFVLKILSGSLNGVEYTLLGDETIFHVGPHEDLVNGRAEAALGNSENAYFLPADEVAAAAFIVQVSGSSGANASVRLGQRSNDRAAWEWKPLALQQPACAAETWFAVRHADAAWATEVTGFVAPSIPGNLPAAMHHPELRGRKGIAPGMLLGGVLLLAVAVSSAWFYWQYRPETRIRGLASILQDAPSDYQIIGGERDRLYVFSDSAAARSWAERASRRLQRRGDIHLIREQEARRLESLLIAAGVDVVVVRLQDPARPDIVLNSASSNGKEEQVRQALAGHIPWAHQLQIGAVSDQELVALARRKLRVLGVSTRIEPRGTYTSVVNDVFLDDAALAGMAAAASAFHAEWGSRRISIQPRLWDDLLQGRSYRYSPSQLLSVGSGRWDYAGAAGQNAQAAP